jgi:hypothetical protein
MDLSPSLLEAKIRRINRGKMGSQTNRFKSKLTKAFSSFRIGHLGGSNPTGANFAPKLSTCPHFEGPLEKNKVRAKKSGKEHRKQNRDQTGKELCRHKYEFTPINLISVFSFSSQPNKREHKKK